MKADEKQRVVNNFTVLRSLVDMFRQLNDCCALVGRLDGQIVIDASRTPTFLFDELCGPFLACYVSSETEHLSIFSGLSTDVASQTILLDASSVLHQDSESTADYPGVYEIRHRLDGIPPLPPELADHLRLCSFDQSLI